MLDDAFDVCALIQGECASLSIAGNSDLQEFFGSSVISDLPLGRDGGLDGIDSFTVWASDEHVINIHRNNDFRVTSPPEVDARCAREARKPHGSKVGIELEVLFSTRLFEAIQPFDQFVDFPFRYICTLGCFEVDVVMEIGV